MKVRIAVLVLAMSVLVLTMSACQAAATPTPVAPARVLRFSVVTGEQSSWYKGAAKFAELVKQRTNGSLAVSVFPGASLASGDQVKELDMLRNGTIDFAYNANTLYSNLDQRFSVVILPWLFSSDADVDKMLTGPLGQDLLKVCESYGIIGLALGENGFRQITNSKREIKTPADLKGLKIRIPSVKMYTSVFSALGATTTSLNLGEAYNAMQNGVVDGQENAVDQVVSNKFYDVQKYMTIWNYSYSALILGMNRGLWNSLDPATQNIIRKAAEEASAFQVQESRKVTDTQLQLLRDKGMTITVLSPDQIKPFRDLVAPVYTEYEPVIGKDLMDKFVAGNR
jgi:tripartite ATP-independent transporter DctP family solute receptor